MNATTPRPVDAEVMRVLHDGVECSGPALVITAQLDRKLYEKVAKVLSALGGTWNRKAKATLFLIDAADAIDPVLLTGQIAYPSDYGFFETPPDVVKAVIDQANIQPGMKVLEPSCGTGNLALAAARLTGWVDCVELQPDKAAECRQRLAKEAPGVMSTVLDGDFLAKEPGDLFGPYDVVVMNPPFSRQADIIHITHALRFLKPGGRLVSVASAGVQFRSDRRASAFREQLYVQHSGWSCKLPERAFRSSGTDVNTCLVWCNKNKNETA